MLICKTANWESQLSVIEKNTFLDLFKKVDADNKGIVLHDEAMDFLKKSDIPQNILTQVILCISFFLSPSIHLYSFGMLLIMKIKDS